MILLLAIFILFSTTKLTVATLVLLKVIFFKVRFKFIKKHELKFDEFHFHDAGSKGVHLALGDGHIDLKYFKDLAIKNNAWVLLEVKSSEDLIKSVPYYKNL